MKYSLYVNQGKAIELGLNINQAHILDLLCSSPTWAEAEVFESETYYWVARQKIAAELPILDLKPDTIYRHLKRLSDLGLIKHVKNGKKDLVKLTEIGKGYYIGNKSEYCEEYGNKSEKTRKQIRKNSDLNPTDPITIDQDTIDTADKIPFGDIANLYTEITGKNVLGMSNKRKGHISARWNSSKKHQSMAFWEWLFNQVNDSDFLSGRTSHNFKVSLDWIVNENNFIKIIEGNYQ